MQPLILPPTRTPSHHRISVPIKSPHRSIKLRVFGFWIVYLSVCLYIELMESSAMVVVAVLSLFFLVFLTGLEGRNIKNTPMEEEEEEKEPAKSDNMQPGNVFGGIGSVMVGPGGTSTGSGIGVILPGSTVGNIGSPFNIGSVLPGSQLPAAGGGGTTALPFPGSGFPGVFGSVPIPGGGQIIGGVFGESKASKKRSP